MVLPGIPLAVPAQRVGKRVLAIVTTGHRSQPGSSDITAAGWSPVRPRRLWMTAGAVAGGNLPTIRRNRGLGQGFGGTGAVRLLPVRGGRPDARRVDRVQGVRDRGGRDPGTLAGRGRGSSGEGF